MSGAMEGVGDRSFDIVTLGCRLNQADSIAVARELMEAGMVPWEGLGIPWLTVVNTCAVTGESMKKSRKAARRSFRRGGERLLVTGCGVDLEPETFAGLPGVTDCFSHRDGGARRRFVDTIRNGEHAVGDPWGYVRGNLSPARVRVPVKVQEGCDRGCAYCVIPYVRGRSRSREANEILQEIRHLESHGVKEVVLTGTDLGDYGRPDAQTSPVRLLLYLLRGSCTVRFRLSSLEVDGVTDELVGLMASEERICRHLHIPLQSGDARTLAAMGRDYTPEEYLSRVEMARSAMADIAVTTDILVGFPGEDRESFERTMRFTSSADFAKVHVFRYSSRPGTRAEVLKDDVEPAEKVRRSRALARIAGRSRRSFHHSLVGSILPVVVEGPSSTERGYYVGHSDNYVRVIFKGNDGCLGEVVWVRLDDADEEGGRGSITKNEMRTQHRVAIR